MEQYKKFKVEAILAGLAYSLLILYGRLVNAESIYSNSLNRGSDPVVITGAELRSLNRVAVDRIVGFRFQEDWEQIPIQIDERKYVDFGVVYNNSPVDHGIVAYTDPDTYVGPDTNPSFDVDDELVFMAKDAGDPAPLSGDFPLGVLEESYVEIQIYDPLDDAVGYVYLFESDGSLGQAAGEDYVTYNFRLLKGSYVPNYNKGSGYNQEDSEIHTDAYRTHFSDRWIRDELQIFSGFATGEDILDRHTTGRGPGDCSRNENTASEGGGVFFANKDGCIRAIRSYMGYNSGPYIQRDHFFYERRHDMVGYIRVHATTHARDLYDYSENATGMVYSNNLNNAGVLIDGQPETLKNGPLFWELVTGHQGTLIICHAFDTDIPGYQVTSFYSDSEVPPLAHCTGDGREFGLSGAVWDPIPDTDPVLTPNSYNSLIICRTVYYEDPHQELELGALKYEQWSTSLQVEIGGVKPIPPIYVDDDALSDPEVGDPTISDPLEDGSLEHPFDAIQEAIDYALDGETVIVLSGTYTGEGNRDLDFKGKAIALRSQNGPSECIINCEGFGRGSIFQSGEGQDSVLAGFTITGGEADRGGSICCLNASHPTIMNCILRGNLAIGSSGRSPEAYGGGIYCQLSNPTITNCTLNGNSALSHGGGIYCENSNPTLTNSISWGNSPDEIYGDNISIIFSNIQGGFVGESNLDFDPLFADPESGDYHLKSQVGRYDPHTQIWMVDDVTSPCIDAGDPTSPISSEPSPNGAVVNMGAYGGTSEASKSLNDGL